MLQDGSFNRYSLVLNGSGLQRGFVSQRGDGNTAIEYGLPTLPLQIQQNGNGMRMIIRHSTGY